MAEAVEEVVKTSFQALIGQISKIGNFLSH